MDCFISYENFLELNEVLKLVTEILKDLKVSHWLDHHTLRNGVMFGNIEPWAKYTNVSCTGVALLKKYEKFKKLLNEHNLHIINTHYYEEISDSFELSKGVLENIETIFIKKGNFNKEDNSLQNNHTFSLSKFENSHKHKFENSNKFYENFEYNLKLNFQNVNNNNKILFPLDTLVLGKYKYNVPHNYIYYVKNNVSTIGTIGTIGSIGNKSEVNNYFNYINSSIKYATCDMKINNVFSNKKVLAKIGEYYKSVNNDYFNSFFTNMFYTQNMPTDFKQFKQLFNSLSRIFKASRMKSGQVHKIVQRKNMCRSSRDLYKGIFPIIHIPIKTQIIDLNRTRSKKSLSPSGLNDKIYWLRYHEFYFILYLSKSPSKLYLKNDNNIKTFLNFIILKKVNNKSILKSNKLNLKKNKVLNLPKKDKKSVLSKLKIIDHKVVYFEENEKDKFKNSWVELDLSKTGTSTRVLIRNKSDKFSKKIDKWITYPRKNIFMFQFSKLYKLFSICKNPLIIINNNLKELNKNECKNNDVKNKIDNVKHHNWFKKLQKHYGKMKNKENSLLNEIMHIHINSPMVEFNDIDYIGIGQITVNVSHGYSHKFNQSLKDLINYNEKMNKPLSILKFMFVFTVNKFTKKLHRVSNAFITRTRQNNPIGIVKDHSQPGHSFFTNFTIIYHSPNSEMVQIMTVSKATLDHLLSHTNTDKFNPSSYKFFKIIAF
jgi:hypothetical protein